MGSNLAYMLFEGIAAIAMAQGAERGTTRFCSPPVRR